MDQAMTPTGVVSTESGYNLSEIQNLQEEAPTLVASRKSLEGERVLDEAIVHIEFKSDASVNNIATSLILVSKEYIDTQGIRGITPIFKNCALYNVGAGLTVNSKVLSDKDSEDLNALLQTHFLLIPIRGISKKGCNNLVNTPTKIRFSGINFKAYRGNSLFDRVLASKIYLVGMVVFGRVITTPKVQIQYCTDTLATNYEDLNAALQCSIVELLDKTYATKTSKGAVHAHN